MRSMREIELSENSLASRRSRKLRKRILKQNGSHG